MLFICSQNRLRSPTAERLFSNRPGFEVASAGLNPDAETPVCSELLEWADIIFVMERTHRSESQRRQQSNRMQKKVSTDSTIVYEQRPRAALWLGAACALMLVAGITLSIPVLGIVVLSGMSIVGIAVGLSNESLILDFSRKRLLYRSSWAWFRFTNISDDFRNVKAIAIHDNSVSRPSSGEVSVQPAWIVVLNYAGAIETAWLVGTFTNRESALEEGRMLSERIGAPVEALVVPREP